MAESKLRALSVDFAVQISGIKKQLFSNPGNADKIQ